MGEMCGRMAGMGYSTCDALLPNEPDIVCTLPAGHEGDHHDELHDRVFTTKNEDTE